MSLHEIMAFGGKLQTIPTMFVQTDKGFPILEHVSIHIDTLSEGLMVLENLFEKDTMDKIGKIYPRQGEILEHQKSR